MADVVVVVGGPTELSTALFTAKNGLETVVFEYGSNLVARRHCRSSRRRTPSTSTTSIRPWLDREE